MRIEKIGTPARFLVPSAKVFRTKLYDGIRVVKYIHNFLVGNFGGFTMASGNINGYFRDNEYDEHREYRLSIPNKDHAHLRWVLEEFLAEICELLNEECIYLEVGLDAMLVYPDEK